MFPDDPSSFWSLVSAQLIGSSPWLIVEIAGLIVGFVFLRRARMAAVLVVIACAASLLSGLGYIFGHSWLLHRLHIGDFIEDPNDWFAALGIGTSLIRAGAFALLVIAALSWRATPMQAVAPSAPRSGAALPLGEASPISKGLFLGSIYGSGLVAWVAIVPMVALMIEGDRDTAGVLLGLSCFVGLVAVYGAVMGLVLLYKLWDSIQPASATPGKAIGFLFIPLFNLYWVFRVYRGWAVEANQFLAAHRIETPRASVGLATAVCVLLVISAIPYAGLPFGLIAWVMLFFHLNRAITIANAIRGARGPATDGVISSGL